MFWRPLLTAASLALVSGPAWGQSTTIRMSPSVIVGPPGSIVNVPIIISTTQHISIIRLTIDYNANAATFLCPEMGWHPLAAGFRLMACNANPPFLSPCPGTNANATVVLLAGAGGFITGINQELLILQFRLATSPCAISPICFDSDCNHTDGSTFEGDYLCGSNLQLIGGAIANGCTSDALAETIGLRLLPNSPNPFNPTTLLTFEKPFDGPATLEIVNVAGHRVRTMLTGDVQAGRHELIWDGRDANGHRVAAGVYFARLQTPEATVSRSLVLVQ